MAADGTRAPSILTVRDLIKYPRRQYSAFCIKAAGRKTAAAAQEIGRVKEVAAIWFVCVCGGGGGKEERAAGRGAAIRPAPPGSQRAPRPADNTGRPIWRSGPSKIKCKFQLFIRVIRSLAARRGRRSQAENNNNNNNYDYYNNNYKR
jgi:hypothetical protein